MQFHPITIAQSAGWLKSLTALKNSSLPLIVVHTPTYLSVLNTMTPQKHASSLALFPRDEKDAWTTLVRIAKVEQSSVVVSLVSDFLQLTHAMMKEVEGSEILIAPLKPWNLEVAAQFLVDLRTRGIVVQKESAAPLLEILQKRGLEKQAFLVCLIGLDEAPLEKTAVTTYMEYHIVPGIPVLYQCPFLAREKKNLFHPNPALFFESSGKKIVATDRRNKPRFVRVALPKCVLSSHVCPCKEPHTFERI